MKEVNKKRILERKRSYRVKGGNFMYKAVVFDIGQTLIQYNKPLNWSSLYKPALEYMAEECNYFISDDQVKQIIAILTKYNTRVNPREYEVSSDVIFDEIFDVLNESKDGISKAKEAFYQYFRREAYPFDEVKETLSELKALGIQTATLSDVAYGMDNIYALEDISSIVEYIDYPFTSNDIGYRKPHVKGLQIIAEKMGISLEEMIYVGDEAKDMVCANNAGAYSVLINRSNDLKEYNQKKEISSLCELLEIIK